MSKKKILLAGVLCVLMLLTLISCGDEKKAEKKENVGAEETSSEEIPAEEKTTDNKELSEEEQKALDEATKADKEKLDKNAADSESSINLSHTYAEHGQYTDAANTIKRAIGYAPTDETLYNELMGVYKQSGNTVEALSYIDTIADDATRRKYIDEAYDRNSANALPMGNTMGNLTAGGMFAFDGETVFFCDAAKGNYLTKLEGGKTTVLLENGCSYLNVVGDYLYFVNKNDYFIYKMKKDGTELSKVSETMATNLVVIGNKMYFINWADECKIYSINLDGSNEKKLSDISTEVLYAYGPYIYVNDRNSMRELYRISLEDGSSYMLTMDDTYFITGYDNMIYFRNGSDALNVYRMTATGEVYAPINTARSGYLNADKGYLYFTNFEEEALYKVRDDGTELTKLCDGDPSYTSVNGDYLYFFSDSDGKKLYRIRKDGTGKECLN